MTLVHDIKTRHGVQGNSALLAVQSVAAWPQALSQVRHLRAALGVRQVPQALMDASLAGRQELMGVRRTSEREEEGDAFLPCTLKVVEVRRI